MMEISPSVMHDLRRAFANLKNALSELGKAEAGSEQATTLYNDLASYSETLERELYAIEIPPEVNYALTPNETLDGWVILKQTDGVWAAVSGVEYSSLTEAAAQIPGLIDEDETPAPADWVQPLGAGDAYQPGDQVTHVGKVWESIEADNVWEPGVYGWREVI